MGIATSPLSYPGFCSLFCSSNAHTAQELGRAATLSQQDRAAAHAGWTHLSSIRRKSPFTLTLRVLEETFWVGFTQPNYMGILICQYKDPYKPISILECYEGFEHCSFSFKCPDLHDVFQTMHVALFQTSPNKFILIKFKQLSTRKTTRMSPWKLVNG